MSRGLGQLQRRILAQLYQHEKMSTADLMWAIKGSESGWHYDYYTGSTSMRRALKQLERQGLADGSRYYIGVSGRPVAWRITEAGRELCRSWGAPAESQDH